MLERVVMERSYNVEDQLGSLLSQWQWSKQQIPYGISIFEQMPDLGAVSDLLQPCHVRVKLSLDFCRTGCRSQGAALGRACLRK
jgi:hypothetical protein